MKFFFIAFAILFAGVTFAQGEYLDRGVNGYELGAAFSSNDNVYGIAAVGAFSMYGTFDLGLSYAWLTSGGETSTAISPFANLHILKQSMIFPFGLTGIIQFQNQSFTSEYAISTASFLTYGGSIYRSFELSEKYSLQPFFTYTITSQIDSEREVSSTAISLAFISNVDKMKYIIHPSVSFTGNAIGYSLALEIAGILQK